MKERKKKDGSMSLSERPWINIKKKGGKKEVKKDEKIRKRQKRVDRGEEGSAWVNMRK